MDQAWQQLADAQSGMLSRRQLAAFDVDHNHVRHQVEARRWVVHTPMVVGTVTGPLTFTQRVWMGFLHAGPTSAVGGLTAAQLLGLQGWQRPQVCILVDEDLKVEPVGGVDFVRTRRDLDAMVHPESPARVARIEPAALLYAGYTRSTRTACGLLAAVVQQRLTGAEELRDWVERMRPLRRARLFRSTLAEIAGGAESVAEIDIARICRRFSMPVPQRQVRRRDASGTLRFTDCEWRLLDGQRVVLEIDGAFHMDVAHWEADMGRERGLVAGGSLVLRCTTGELRRTPGAVMADLAALGVGRGSHASA